MNLKKEVEERKVSLSAYKTAVKKRTQVVVIMMGRGSFPLRSFIIPEEFIGMEGGRILKVGKKEYELMQ